jgi:ABC-type transport system involved in cytochrome c biogenesis permease subunit
VQRITLLCFAASYALALLLELWHLRKPRPVLRLVSIGWGIAGLFAQTVYLAVQRPPLGWQYGLLLVLAWILAIFYLYGSLHHARVAWGVFVLPVILALVGLATLLSPPAGQNYPRDDAAFWGQFHGVVMLLATVGMCVGFVASAMYLVQAYRLRAKLPPGRGLKLMSLERLEAMNRRAIVWAFPLLTLGMLTGVILMVRLTEFVNDWTDPRIVAAAVLWVVFALLLYLRYAVHTRPRRLALLTIVAFGMLLVTLVLPHMGKGVTP